MVEFYSTNPATAARYKEDEQARMRAGELRIQEDAFRQRYTTERNVAVDAAVRRGLGGGLGGVRADGSGGEQPQQPQQPQRPPPQGGRPVQDPQPQAQPQPQAGAAGGGNNLMRELTATPGGGALALEQHQQKRQREDALEDKAIDAIIAGNYQLAETLMMRATGRGLPPLMKTEGARKRIMAADSFAKERYPTNIEEQRKFFTAYLEDPGAAINAFPGEGPQAERVSIKATSDGFAGVTYTPGQGYSAEQIQGPGGYTPQPAAKGGAAGTYLWELKRKAWLALYDGDEAGALTFASGTKQMSDAELRESSFKLAPEYIPEPFPGTPEEATRTQDLMNMADKLYLSMRGPRPEAAPGIDVGGSRVDTRGDSGARDQIGSRDVPGIAPPAAPGAAPTAAPQAAPPQFPETAGPPEPTGAGLTVPQGQRQPYQAEGADVAAWKRNRGGAPAVMDAPPGTEENPLVPQVQADIDNAPSGTVILIEGVKWKKP